MTATVHSINRRGLPAAQTPDRPNFAFTSGSANPFKPEHADRRFTVEICRPDGSVDRTVVVGGSSIEHAAAAMDRGGLGAVVRVLELPFHLTEGA